MFGAGRAGSLLHTAVASSATAVAAAAVALGFIFVASIGVATAITPTPTPTPPPGIPSTVKTFVNDTGQVVNDLHVEVDLAGFVDLLANAPGCPAPSLPGTGPFPSFDVVWSATCVDPGESVTLEIFSDCLAPLCGPPVVSSHYWTLDGTPVGTPTPTPTPTLPPPGPPLGVGGIAGLLDADDGVAPPASQSSSDNTGYIAALAGVIGAMLIAGGWFARRRWAR